MDAFLALIGANPADLFWAFTGGICGGLVTMGPKPQILPIFIAVFVGTAVGTAGAPVIPPLFGYKPSTLATLFIGASGLPIIKMVIAVAKRVKWSPFDRKIGENG